MQRAGSVWERNGSSSAVTRERTEEDLREAQLQALDFDLNLTGFSADELLRLLGSEQNEGLTDAAGFGLWRHRGQRRSSSGDQPEDGLSPLGRSGLRAAFAAAAAS